MPEMGESKDVGDRPACRTWAGTTPRDLKAGDWVLHAATGRTFQWDPSLHRRSEDWDRLRATLGDPLGESALDEDSVVAEASVVPPWVDWGRVDRGCEAFIANLPLAGFSLLHLSLVGGFAAPAIVKTLKRTGQLCPPEATRKIARRRVLRTLGMVERAMCGGLRPGEPGWRAVVDTRIVHAQVS